MHVKEDWGDAILATEELPIRQSALVIKVSGKTVAMHVNEG